VNTVETVYNSTGHFTCAISGRKCLRCIQMSTVGVETEMIGVTKQQKVTCWHNNTANVIPINATKRMSTVSYLRVKEFNVADVQNSDFPLFDIYVTDIAKRTDTRTRVQFFHRKSPARHLITQIRHIERSSTRHLVK
jgi:hypothetical protein